MYCGDVVYTVTPSICTDVDSLFSFVILKIGGNVAASSNFCLFYDNFLHQSFSILYGL